MTSNRLVDILVKSGMTQIKESIYYGILVNVLMSKYVISKCNNKTSFGLLVVYVTMLLLAH